MSHAPGQHTGSESLGWWWETSRAQTKQRESPHSALLLPYLEMKRPKGPQAGHSLLRDRQSQVTVHREAQNRGSIAEPLKDTPAKPYGAHLQPLDLTGNPRVTGWLASPKAHPGSGLECPHKPKHLPCEIHAKDNYPYSPPWLLPHLAKHIWHLSPVSTKTW